MVDKTVSLTCDYLTSSSSSRVNLIQVNSNNAEITRSWVQLTPNNTFNQVKLTCDLDSACVKIIIRVLLDNMIFLDNVFLKIQ